MNNSLMSYGPIHWNKLNIDKRQLLFISVLYWILVLYFNVHKGQRVHFLLKYQTTYHS